MEPMITVADFCFCKNHGSEYCNKCFCDYRDVNNVQLEDCEVLRGLQESGDDEKVELGEKLMVSGL
jgi:hypothetical protein